MHVGDQRQVRVEVARQHLALEARRVRAASTRPAWRPARRARRRAPRATCRPRRGAPTRPRGSSAPRGGADRRPSRSATRSPRARAARVWLLSTISTEPAGPARRIAAAAAAGAVATRAPRSPPSVADSSAPITIAASLFGRTTTTERAPVARYCAGDALDVVRGHRLVRGARARTGSGSRRRRSRTRPAPRRGRGWRRAAARTRSRAARSPCASSAAGDRLRRQRRRRRRRSPARPARRRAPSSSGPRSRTGPGSRVGATSPCTDDAHCLSTTSARFRRDDGPPARISVAHLVGGAVAVAERRRGKADHAAGRPAPGGSSVARTSAAGARSGCDAVGRRRLRRRDAAVVARDHVQRRRCVEVAGDRPAPRCSARRSACRRRAPSPA